MLAESLTYLRAAFPRAAFPPETVEVYVQELADLPDEEVVAACRRIGRRAMYLPSIGEIRREVAEARLQLPTAGVAWQIISTGSVAEKRRHPAVWDAYQALGGQWALNSSERPGMLRHTFERDYEARREECLLREMGTLPGELPPAGSRDALPPGPGDEPSTPVERRMARRFLGESLAPPTDEEKRDAIRVLKGGHMQPDPKGDAIYAEAERIFAEGAS